MFQYVTNNVTICSSAIESIKSGDVPKLAKCMKDAQASFNRCAAPNCPSQLASPILNKVINDNALNELTLAIKGVGSQGDGSVQMLCESPQKQQEVIINIINNIFLLSFRFWSI